MKCTAILTPPRVVPETARPTPECGSFALLDVDSLAQPYLLCLSLYMCDIIVLSNILVVQSQRMYRQQDVKEEEEEEAETYGLRQDCLACDAGDAEKMKGVK